MKYLVIPLIFIMKFSSLPIIFSGKSFHVNLGFFFRKGFHVNLMFLFVSYFIIPSLITIWAI